MNARELKRRLTPLLRTPLHPLCLLRMASGFPLGDLTGTVLEWVRRKSPWLVVVPLLGLTIAVVNLVGWLVGQLGTDQTTMPHRIRLLSQQPGQDGA